ncbi:MAG: DUF5615 family PIN-like protein [Pseudomonadota bacterium]
MPRYRQYWLAGWSPAATKPPVSPMSGILDGPDSAICRYAREDGAVILTKDEDFAVWRNAADDPMPRVVWLRVGNTRKKELLRWFEPLLPRILSALESGEGLVEVT